ncbi:hypothetical protein [Paraburkholderia caffeinilytica]|uniref:hypothetical protein n=1 Tax=Paraburkholderia caffeinilytica TaxID=1761016 RepID=UPI003DA06737
MENEALAALPPLHRLLWIYLWMLADREGRLEDRPQRIKVKALPYDSANVDAMLRDLHQAGFIIRYAVSGRRFIQIVNFAKHQKPHGNEAESEIPPPETADPAPAEAVGAGDVRGDEGLTTMVVSPSDSGDKDFAPEEQALGPCISDSLIDGFSDSLKKNKTGARVPRASPRFDARGHLFAAGVDPKIAGDWLTLRKAKRASVTETAMAGVEREAAKAGITLENALRMCCERGWAGFRASWLDRDGHASRGPPHGARDGAPLDSLDGPSLDAMAREFGIAAARPGESMSEFIGRLKAAQRGRRLH